MPRMNIQGLQADLAQLEREVDRFLQVRSSVELKKVTSLTLLYHNPVTIMCLH
jgi:hypothetical protein